MMYYSEKRRRIEAAFQSKFKPEEKESKKGETVPCGNSYDVRDFSDSELIVQSWMGIDRKMYKVPYSEGEDGYSFKGKDSWVPVVEETEYVPENGKREDTGSMARDEKMMELHDE